MAVGAGQLLVDGCWVEAAEDRRRDVVDPATGDVVTTVAEAGAAALLREHAEDLARPESLDVGKPLVFTRSVDVPSVIDTFEHLAGLAAGIVGAVRMTAFPSLAYIRREPVGVVAAIAPSNFPLILSTSKLAPALVAGNTVVHKPAEETTLTALRVARLFHRVHSRGPCRRRQRGRAPQARHNRAGRQGSRLLVERPVYDAVVGALRGAVAHVPVGNPFAEGTVVGPTAGPRHLAKVRSYLDRAATEPVEVVSGPEALHEYLRTKSVVVDLV